MASKRDVSVGVKITGDSKGFKNATEEARRASEKLRQEIGSKAKSMEQGFNGVVGSINRLAGVFGAALSAQQLISVSSEMVQMAASAEGIKKAFEGLNSPDLLQRLQAATHNTVEDIKLMQYAVQSNNFRIALSQLPTYFEFATQRAKDTGESVDYLVDSIVRGIGRKSALILDNLGISASDLNDQLKKTPDYAEAVGAIIAREMGNAGKYIEDDADKIAQLRAQFANLKVELGGKILKGGISKELEDAVYFMKSLNNEGDSFFKLIWARLNQKPGGVIAAELLGPLNIFFPKFREKLDELFGKDTWDKIKHNVDLRDEFHKNAEAAGKFFEELQQKIIPGLSKWQMVPSAPWQMVPSAPSTPKATPMTPIPAINLPSSDFNEDAFDIYGITKIQPFNKELYELQQAIADNEAELDNFFKKWQEGQDAINATTEAGYRLGEVFDQMFMAGMDGWDSWAKAAEDAIKRIISKLAALTAAYLIINALTGGTASLAGLGNFLKGGFGIPSLPSSGSASSSGGGKLATTIYGRDITIASDRYISTLYKNT